SSLTLAVGQNYEFAALQFDGANFRLVTATPQTLNNLGGLVGTGSPASSSACTTNQITHDSNFLYICTAPNTWKRAAITGGHCWSRARVAQQVGNKRGHPPAESEYR